MASPRRTLLAALVPVLALSASMAWWLTVGGGRADQPNVIFIVLDTVRSDRLSMCGYGKPTSPNMIRLRDTEGWKATCGAKTPGTWTLPTHASFFTGVSPLEHGSHALISGIKDLKSVKARIRKLHAVADRPTLAQRFADRGYDTVAVSANPVVNDKLGLLEGFRVRQISKKWGDSFNKKLVRALEAGLDKANPDAPLFLFLNIADAHAPWTSVPKRVGWLPKTKSHRYQKLDKESFWQRYLEQRMTDEEAKPWLDRVHNLYLWGIRRADKNLAKALEVIEDRGLCEDGCRIVLTSDHGEMTGEHRVLDHGHYVWEEMVGVPLMTYGIEGELPNVMNAGDAFDLLLDGAIDKPREVISMGWPHIRRCAHTARKAYCNQSLALWSEGQKYTWIDGKMHTVDLASDPLEQERAPVTASAARARLEALSAEMTTDSSDKNDDEEVIEVLRSLGYID
jgi:arylsulfatase A-like enzyme